LLWVGAAFCAALGLSACVLAAAGTGEEGVHRALLATARLGFLFFWPAYAGSALVSLFGPTFQPLKRHARELGLAFAAVLIIHLSLVLRLCLIGRAPSIGTFIIFGTAAVFTYLIAIFSIARLQRAMGPKYWRFLRVLGLNYVACAFALDFLRNPLGVDMLHAVAYMPFAVFAVGGICLRVAELLVVQGEPPTTAEGPRQVRKASWLN
jgi:hypothetical protein